MKIEKTFDRVHSTVTSKRPLQLFTAFTRVLLAVGFIPPSIPKIMYKPFTSLPDSNPVGHYFNALYQTGFYYQFIGWGQIIAAVLLLIPGTSHLGAIMFFPIILNITVLTNSVGFMGTWLLTIMMLMACAYLVCWDYDRWKPILFGRRELRSNSFNYDFIWIPLLFAVGVVALFAVISYFAVGNTSGAQYERLLLITSIGFVFGMLVTLHHRFMRAGDLKGAASDKR